MSARIKDFASLAHHWGISEADRRRIIAEKSKLLDETLERATAEVIAAIRAAKCRHCSKFASLGRACTAVSHLECDCPKCQGFCKCKTPYFASSPQQRESEREAEVNGTSIETYLREQH